MRGFDGKVRFVVRRLLPQIWRHMPRLLLHKAHSQWQKLRQYLRRKQRRSGHQVAIEARKREVNKGRAVQRF